MAVGRFVVCLSELMTNISYIGGLQLGKPCRWSLQVEWERQVRGARQRADSATSRKADCRPAAPSPPTNRSQVLKPLLKTPQWRHCVQVGAPAPFQACWAQCDDSIPSFRACGAPQTRCKYAVASSSHCCSTLETLYLETLLAEVAEDISDRTKMFDCHSLQSACDGNTAI